jgi:hypothetical protein
LPVPNAPSGLSANAVSETRIDLNWMDNSENEDGFRIEAKTDAEGDYSQIATLEPDINVYSHTGLSPGTTYFYRVSAFNSYGDSSYSNDVSVTTSGVDYVILNPSFPITGIVDTSFNGSFTIKNMGFVNGSKNITWVAYRSQDSVIDAGDAQVATEIIPAIDADVESTAINFTGIWLENTGTYYLIIVISAADDGNVSNNNAVSNAIDVATPFTDYIISNVSFPDVGVVNASFNGDFTVTNSGNVAGSQTITWNVYRSDNPVYDVGVDTQIDFGTQTALGAGQTTSTIDFNGTWPSTDGTYYLIIIISAIDDSNTDNNKATSNSINISKSIIISVSPTSLDFGTVIKYQTLDKTVTINNDVTSSSNLTGSVSITGSNYTIISGGGFYDLAPGSSKTVTVRFSPSSTGPKTGSVSITHNATNASNPIAVPLTGTGVDYIGITVSPTSLNFGSVTVNQYSDKTVTISNSSSSTTNLTGTVSISGTYYSIISGSGTYTLSPGGSKTVTLRFSPSGTSSIGTKTGSLYVYHNGDNDSSPINVLLSGIGEPIVWSGYASQDTYYWIGNSMNWNGMNSLVVGTDVSDIYRTLIDFNVGNIPSQATVVEATLRLRRGTSTIPLNIYIGWVIETWDESTVSGVNWPSFAYHSSYYTVPTSGTYAYFDVKYPFQELLYEGLNEGFCLMSTTEGTPEKFASFYPREYGTSYAPYLTVKYVP